LQIGRTLNEIIREAKTIEKLETNQNNIKIIYDIIGTTDTSIIITCSHSKKGNRVIKRKADRGRNAGKIIDEQPKKFGMLTQC
jgi:hypothetical protein